MKNDVTYIAMILGLFVLAFGLVAACDRIIGADEQAATGDGSPTAEADTGSEKVAA